MDVIIAILITVLMIMLENIEIFGKYLIYLIPPLILYVIVRIFVGPIIKRKQENDKFKFNEFEDFENIEQDQDENEQLKNEFETISDTFSGSEQPVFFDEEETAKRMAEAKAINNIEYEEEIKEGNSVVSILDEDNAFDAELFKKWSKNIFLYMQLGKEEEIKQIKDSISGELFNRKIVQMNRFAKDNLELKRENLLIEEIKILDYSRWADKAEIKVYIKIQMTEYIANKQTGKVLRGNARKINDRSYIMTFRKKESQKQVGFVRNCQSCGASISDTEFSRCQYCGSLVNPIRYNWTLVKFEVV